MARKLESYNNTDFCCCGQTHYIIIILSDILYLRRVFRFVHVRLCCITPLKLVLCSLPILTLSTFQGTEITLNLQMAWHTYLRGHLLQSWGRNRIHTPADTDHGHMKACHLKAVRRTALTVNIKWHVHSVWLWKYKAINTVFKYQSTHDDNHPVHDLQKDQLMNEYWTQTWNKNENIYNYSGLQIWKLTDVIT